MASKTFWETKRALWTHRYAKFTHILGKFASVGWKYLYLRWLKYRTPDRALIAIILSEQIGDIIACEPVAREVRRRHPNDYIIWIVREPYIELVKHHPDLDGYLTEKCPSERIYLLKTGIFDQVYNLHISHRKCKYCPEDPINPTADKIGLTFDNYYHRGDLLYIFSQAAGLPALTADPKMYIPETVRQRISDLQLQESPIVLHCQSSHIARDWPASHWNKLVKWLLDTYQHPVIELGLTPVITLQHPNFRNLCGQLSLLETAEVIHRAHLFIGIDSGLAHMANAGNTPGIILLGQLYDFVDYLPFSGRYKRGENIIILNNFGYPCSELPYTWVKGTIQRQLGEPKFA